jgi:hypothetical protein
MSSFWIRMFKGISHLEVGHHRVALPSNAARSCSQTTFEAQHQAAEQADAADEVGDG